MLFQAPKVVVICYIQKHYKTNIVSIAKNTLCPYQSKLSIPYNFMSLRIHSSKMPIQVFHKTTTKPQKEEKKKGKWMIGKKKKKKKRCLKHFKFSLFFFSWFLYKRNHYTIIFPWNTSYLIYLMVRYFSERVNNNVLLSVA